MLCDVYRKLVFGPDSPTEASTKVVSYTLLSGTPSTLKIPSNLPSSIISLNLSIVFYLPVFYLCLLSLCLSPLCLLPPCLLTLSLLPPSTSLYYLPPCLLPLCVIYLCLFHLPVFFLCLLSC